MRLPCPYLAGEVEWTEERERHIGERHPELLPVHRARIEQTVADPDEIRSDADYPETLFFTRWLLKAVSSSSGGLESCSPNLARQLARKVEINPRVGLRDWHLPTGRIPRIQTLKLPR
jgi:hypothetical protein